MSFKAEENNKELSEHILVCLSAAPSNKKIIDTAAKMVKVLQARFTALYVRTGTKSEVLDKEKLEEHIQYAEKLGAEIVMTHGENIPVQIAEYARLSNVTKIVIGQSNARRNHFFSKATLTERLIEIVPDIDIHIIPDALKTRTHQKRSFARYVEKPSAKDYFLTVIIFAVCTLIGLLFQRLNFTDTNIVTIYILGVLLTSIVTDGYLCSRICYKCFFILLFSDRTQDVFSDLCGRVSGNFSHNAYFIRAYGSTCSKAENTCKIVCSACFSYTSFV